MNRRQSFAIWAVVAACALTPAVSRADLDASTIQIDSIPLRPESPDQLLSLQIGSFQPRSVQVGNGSYEFNYGHDLSTVQGEVSWGLKLFDFLGTEYIEAGVGFSALSGNVIAATGSPMPGSNGSYSLDLFGFEPRFAYAASWFPVKWIIPFADAGYRYTVYYQSASSGLGTAEGGAGNFAFGAGLRVWLDRNGSLHAGKTPVYLSVKYDRLLPSSSSLDLASSSWLGGLSFGF